MSTSQLQDPELAMWSINACSPPVGMVSCGFSGYLQPSKNIAVGRLVTTNVVVTTSVPRIDSIATATLSTCLLKIDESMEKQM